MRFVGTRDGQILGKPVPQLLFESVQTCKVINVIYPPRDARGKELKADPKILGVLRNLKIGDIVLLKASELNGQHILTSLELYSPKAGEEEPGVFVFHKRTPTKIGTVSYSSIVVSKYFQDVTVILPHTKNLAGGMTADANMTNLVAAFNEGDLVFIQAESMGGQTILRGIQKYDPPLQGEMVRIVPASPKDANSVPVVEVKTASGTETLRFPGTKNSYGRFTADSSMMSYVSSIKPGQQFDYRLRVDDTAKVISWCRSATERPKNAIASTKTAEMTAGAPKS